MIPKWLLLTAKTIFYMTNIKITGLQALFEPIVYWLELIILALDISSLVGSTSSLPVIITFTLGF